MSSLIYNNIRIPYLYTTQFNQTGMYESSNTDWYCTKFDISVEGLLNFDYADGIWVPDFTSRDRAITNPLTDIIKNRGPAGMIVALRSRLLAPRRKLSFTVNGVEMIPRPHHETTLVRKPEDAARLARGEGVADMEVIGGLRSVGLYLENPGTVDSMNGPLPQNVQITHLTGNMFFISYHIVAHYYENRRARFADADFTALGGNMINELGQDVLYNRWTESIDLDELQYTTRTRRGKFIIRSDNINAVTPEEVMAAMSVVGLPPSHVRQSSNYVQSEDGLGLDYTVVDREVFKLPPGLAFKASGNYLERLTRMGARKFATVDLTLESNRSVGQATLTRRAVNIAMAKLVANGFSTIGVGARMSILESMSVDIEMYENTVHVVIEAQMPFRNRSGSAVIEPMPLDGTFVFTPFTDFGRGDAEDIAIPPNPVTPDWPRRGYTLKGPANLPIQAAAYWDPSLFSITPGAGQRVDPSTNRITPGIQPGRAGQQNEPHGF